MESASVFIDQKIKEFESWRGKMLAKVRGIIHEAAPDIVEEWKWAKEASPALPSGYVYIARGKKQKS